ncbi:Alkane uptake protein B, partial [Durusdinium trenchii]
MPMPADRSIRVQFSQTMRADSIVLGSACGQGTFRVERADNNGDCIEAVPGRLDVGARSLVFTPDEPWQQGVLYRYVMLSKGTSTPADCGVETLCSSFDYPLQTAVLDGRDPDRGGPNMRIFFRGAAPVEHVFQTLDNLPTLDTNANYFHEDGEPDAQPDPDNVGQFLTPPNATKLEFLSSGGLLLDANLGCGFVGREPGELFLGPNPPPQTCNDKKFIHLVGALNADVCRFGESGDDNLPVMPMPADRSIRVQFSQTMRADSIVLGSACGQGTFRVERADNNGDCIEAVPGRLDVGARSLVFTPDEPWQQGVLYRYVMLSKGTSTPADCGVETLCSSFDYPLQTAVLDGRDPDRGGPNMRIFFRGAAPVEHVFQTLDNLPTLDTNANYFHEDGEPDAQPDPDNVGQFLTPPNATKLEFLSSGGLLLDANLGCGFVGREPGELFLGPNPPPQTCNDKKFIHLVGALNADV